jgi:deazaflavin-dependent oxidoreductase (nitroreductase family)
MVTHAQASTRVPGFVGTFNPIARKLLGIGIPLGPNALITVRGRQSGLPRTTPVALVEIGGRRWVIGTFGNVNWVRNLRAAREATITVGKRREQVSADELSPQEGADFFAQVLGPYVRRLPLGRWLLGSLLGAREILENPQEAGARHPVFEVRPAA